MHRDQAPYSVLSDLAVFVCEHITLGNQATPGDLQMGDFELV